MKATLQALRPATAKSGSKPPARAKTPNPKFSKKTTSAVRTACIVLLVCASNRSNTQSHTQVYVCVCGGGGGDVDVNVCAHVDGCARVDVCAWVYECVQVCVMCVRRLWLVASAEQRHSLIFRGESWH